MEYNNSENNLNKSTDICDMEINTEQSQYYNGFEINKMSKTVSYNNGNISHVSIKQLSYTNGNPTIPSYGTQQIGMFSFGFQQSGQPLFGNPQFGMSPFGMPLFGNHIINDNNMSKNHIKLITSNPNNNLLKQ